MGLPSVTRSCTSSPRRTGRSHRWRFPSRIHNFAWTERCFVSDEIRATRSSWTTPRCQISTPRSQPEKVAHGSKTSVSAAAPGCESTNALSRAPFCELVTRSPLGLSDWYLMGNSSNSARRPMACGSTPASRSCQRGDEHNPPAHIRHDAAWRAGGDNRTKRRRQEHASQITVWRDPSCFWPGYSRRRAGPNTIRRSRICTSGRDRPSSPDRPRSIGVRSRAASSTDTGSRDRTSAVSRSPGGGRASRACRIQDRRSLRWSAQARRCCN